MGDFGCGKSEKKILTAAAMMVDLRKLRVRNSGKKRKESL